MFSVLPISFRFRGKTVRLIEICESFLANPGIGLHPTQIAKHTGIAFAEVNRRLEATPELFVKLPRRPDGITRYRLATSMAARAPEEIEAFIGAQARRESLMLYAGVSMLLCLLLIIVILVGPAV